MSTPGTRYEVGWMRDDASNMEHATAIKRVAIEWARKASIAIKDTGYKYYVFDRMARRGSLCRWDFEAGEIVNQVRRDK